MASAMQTKILQTNGLVNYWPLENGSGVAAKGAVNLTPTGAPGTGTTLVAGGGNSMTFASGISMNSGTMAAPASPFTIGCWWSPTAWPVSAQPMLFGFNNGASMFVRPEARINNSSFNSRGIEIFKVNKTYFIAFTYDGTEMNFYVNGRWSHNFVQAGAFSTSSTFTVGPSSGGRLGHAVVFSRNLGSGELFEMFKLGYTGVPPVFTDVNNLVSDDIVATSSFASTFVGGNTFDGLGRKLNAGSPRPSVTVAVKGNAVVNSIKAPVVGYCSSVICAGAIRSNERHITLSNGTIRHEACHVIDGVGPPPVISNIASPTEAQWTRSYTRYCRDAIAIKTIKTAGDGVGQGEKGYYLSINERDPTTSAYNHSSNPNALYPQGTYADYTNSQPVLASTHLFNESIVTAAALQAYYDLPKDSWPARHVQVVLDQIIAQQFRSDGDWLDGNAADFWMPNMGVAIKLMQPYVDSGKYATWSNTIEQYAKQMTGQLNIDGHGANDHYSNTVGETFYNVNGNRDIQKMHAIWMVYLITGNAKWQRVFEMMYRTTIGAGMPAVGSHAAGPARGWTLTVPSPASSGIPGAVSSDWPAGGATWQWSGQRDQSGNLITSLAGNPHTYVNGVDQGPAQPMGFVVTTAPTKVDGSDGVGVLGERHYDFYPAGFDQNYSHYQLECLNAMLPWVNYDERFVAMANMIFNQFWPYIDQTGNRIVDITTGTIPGNPPWSFGAQGGSRAYTFVQDAVRLPILHTFLRRGLRSDFPHITTPAPAYSTYGALTQTIRKSSWKAWIETNAQPNGLMQQMTATNPQPQSWREMGTMVGSYLLNDPNFSCPITPG